MILIRHPRAAVAPGVCYGRLDLAPATSADDEIAAALAATPPARAVWSSPAGRCRPLADRLARRDGVAVVVEPRLHELDFGAWEGRRWDDIDRAESDPWAADPWRVAPPGGETLAALVARVGAVLAAAPPGAVLVTHAGPVRAARIILGHEGWQAAFTAPVPHARPLAFAAAAS